MSESGGSVLSFGDEDELELTRGGTIFARIGGYLAIALGAYHLWTGYAGGLPFIQQRSIHLAGALTILTLGIMAQSRGRFRHVNRVVWFTATVVIVSFFWFMFTNDDRILRQFARFPVPYLVWAAAVALLGLELTRRVIGGILPAIVLFLMGMLLAAHYLTVPWESWLATTSLADMLNSIGFKNYGIMGSITGVSAGIVASFLVFGAMLAVSGGAQSFLNLARFAVGRYRGGPGKVSLITSAFFGTVSGSAVANVVVDGVFNIPLMKRSGFSPSFAAAVEATTSSGGQLVPPVMGAAAFIMAEFLGIPFSTVILAAVVPIVLFYVGLFVAIHIEAVKQGLPGIPKDQIPKARSLINIEFMGSFGIPIGALLFTIYFFNRSLLFASFVATSIVIAYILVFVKEPFSKRVVRVINGFRRGGEDIARIVAIVVAAQLLISTLSISGIASRVANELAGAAIPVSLSLVFLAVVVIILGFGVPTAAAYVLAASISTPIFASLGVNQLAGHMFILYITVYANITPPVMPATYAAVAIARADVMRAGIQGTRLLLPVLIVPFAFALDPSMLLTEGTLANTLYGSGRMIIGMSLMAAGLAGWFFRRLRVWEGGVLAVGAGLTAFPGIESTIIGLIIASSVAVPILIKRRREGVIVPQTGAGVRVVSSDSAFSDRRGEDWDLLTGKVRAAFESTDLPGMQFQVDHDHGLVIADGLSEASLAALVAARDAGATTGLVRPDVWPIDPSMIRAQVAVVSPQHEAGTNTQGLTRLRPVDFEITIAGKDPLAPGAPQPYRLAVLGEPDRDVRWRYTPEQWDQAVAAVARSFGVLPSDRVLIWHDEIFRDHVALLTAFATLRAEALVVVEDRASEFHPARWLEVVAAGEVTTAFLSTDRLRQLVEYVQAGNPEIHHSLSAIIHGGPEPADEALVRDAIDAFGPIMIQYVVPGPDLAGTVITSEEWLEHEGSIGRVIGHQCETVILGPDGQAVGTDQEGLLALRFTPVARQGDLAAPVDDDGRCTLRTGLRCRRDREGYVYLRGRVESATSGDTSTGSTGGMV